MTQLNKLATAVGVALTLGYGASASAAISAPGALADAMLKLNDFTILAGTGTTAKGAALPLNFNIILDGNGNPVLDPTIAIQAGKVNLLSILNNYQTSANVGGLAGTTNAAAVSNGVQGINVNLVSNVNNPGFVPGTTLNQPQDVTSTYAAAASTSVGNALVSGDQIIVQSQVMTNQANQEAHSQAKQTLTTEFSIALRDAFTFQLNFNADGFLREALGQAGVPNNAFATYNWTAKVEDANANQILIWNPDGTVGSAAGSCASVVGGSTVVGGCTEFADAFLLNDSLSRNSVSDIQRVKSGLFDLELNLGAGAYTFFITHTTGADIQTPRLIPEPTSLALIGLGMLGMGAANRRRKV